MTIEIEYETEKELQVPVREIIEAVVNESLDYEGCPYEAEVSVILTDNPSMIEYETPSDFSHVEEAAEDYFNPETGELLLGDIVISVDKVKEQAEKYGHSQTRELAFLTAHSMLHLCGYDHMEDEERLVMEDKQREILDRLGYRR